LIKASVFEKKILFSGLCCAAVVLRALPASNGAAPFLILFSGLRCAAVSSSLLTSNDAAPFLILFSGLCSAAVVLRALPSSNGQQPHF
jgi:hypothetical protein